jgi:glycosyltransferase involved in cell wall biosynthesis/2-polyprenyl-3-methyl-5-hydroxy-6-metoxy-1,4-benzoquinol methylase
LSSRSQARSRRVGYVLNAFPVVSETFILNEVRAMERGGVELALFPLSRKRQRVRHGAVEELHSPLGYPPRKGLRGSVSLLRAHVAVLARAPRRYLRVLRNDVLSAVVRAVVRPVRSHRRSLRKRWRRHLVAGWIADSSRRLGVVHLHAHYAKEPLAVAERVRRLVGLPYSFAAHAKDLYTSSASTLARRLDRARFAVACHEDGARYLKSLDGGRHAGKVMQVPHGIDTRLFGESPAGERESGLILAVGRLTPKKGFEDLVDACSLMKRSGRRFRCVIIGEGRQESPLRAAIDAAGLTDWMELRPFAPQEALVDWYRRATVLAAPSRVTGDGNRDGIPNVIVEAMGCGLPVVSTPVGSIPEIIDDGRTGVLVQAGHASELAAALGGLLDDRDLALQIGCAAARKVERLDFRRTVRPLVRRFERIACSPVESAVKKVANAAWQPDGIAETAKKVVGLKPRRIREVEQGIAELITPGLKANAWRPDLDLLAQRRLWDEVVKARRIKRASAGLGLEPGPHERVLDLGCGRGGLSVSLAARGASVVGVDLRKRNCLVTRLRGRRYDLSVPTLAGTAERLPFADRSFDRVFCLEVLEHVIDPRAVLREIRRVLVPGGACAVTVVNRWAHLDPHYHLWGLSFMPRSVARRYISLRGRTKQSWRDLQTLDEMHYFSFRRFVRLAREVGFEVIDPERPETRPARRWLHWLARRLSVGFNSARLTLIARPGSV